MVSPSMALPMFLLPSLFPVTITSLFFRNRTVVFFSDVHTDHEKAVSSSAFGEKTLHKALVHSRPPRLDANKKLPESCLSILSSHPKQKFRAEIPYVAWGNHWMPAETHMVRLDCESHRDLQRPNPLDITLKQIHVFQDI